MPQTFAVLRHYRGTTTLKYAGGDRALAVQVVSELVKHDKYDGDADSEIETWQDGLLKSVQGFWWGADDNSCNALEDIPYIG